jgi:hypothetical protein
MFVTVGGSIRQRQCMPPMAMAGWRLARAVGGSLITVTMQVIGGVAES